MDVLDTYSGHTDPGGAAIRRRLDGLIITKISVGPMDNNAFLLVCRATNEALLLDAAAEPDRLADLIGERTEAEAYLHLACQRYKLMRTHRWDDEVVDRLRADPGP